VLVRDIRGEPLITVYILWTCCRAVSEGCPPAVRPPGLDPFDRDSAGPGLRCWEG
jgi:hypothetical protein